MNVKGFSSIKSNLHRSAKPATTFSTTSASSLPHPTRCQTESQCTEDDGSRRWRRCRRTSTPRRRKRESTTMLTSTVVVNSSRWLLKGTLLALLLLCLPAISAAIIFNSDEEPGIRCFCDKQTCGGGALVCAGKYCLIGVRTDESGQGRLDQHCVDEQILPGTATKGCVRDWKKWSEVCICEDSLCNTFAFLRSQIDGNNHEEGLHFANGNGGVGSSSGGAVQRSLYQPLDSQENDPHHNGNDELMMGGGSSSNGRGGRDPRREDAHYHHRRQQQHHSNGRGAPLVLLLVVLPLVVGAFTVFLVFVNYHCKML